jgi:hypothetical protein
MCLCDEEIRDMIGMLGEREKLVAVKQYHERQAQQRAWFMARTQPTIKWY